MAMTWVWCAMIVLSLVFGALGGNLTAVTNAAAEGAAAAIELCISIGGVMCLWSGVMEVMDRCGLSASLARLLRPLLRRLLPNASRGDATMSALCANL